MRIRVFVYICMEFMKSALKVSTNQQYLLLWTIRAITALRPQSRATLRTLAIMSSLAPLPCELRRVVMTQCQNKRQFMRSPSALWEPNQCILWMRKPFSRSSRKCVSPSNLLGLSTFHLQRILRYSFGVAGRGALQETTVMLCRRLRLLQSTRHGVREASAAKALHPLVYLFLATRRRRR